MMENPVLLRPNEYSIPVTMEVDIPGTSADEVDNMGAGFDDDLAGSRGSSRSAGADIRSHLDDLARRHPDLADQLRGFPGETSFSNSASSEKTGSDGQEKSETGQTDQDGTTSQATEGQNDGKIGNLQNHGLRNTVPLVDPSSKSSQPPHPMSQDSGSRSPRAQSAPPQTSEEPQRFVSKIEIHPNHNQAGSNSNQETSEMFIPSGDENQAPASHQTGQQAHNNFNNNQQPQQSEPAKAPHVKQPNVRHIPIFVEGRDAPIVNQDHEPSPAAPSYQPPPGYHEPHQRYREPIFEPMYSQGPHVDRPFGGGVNHTSGGVGFDIPIHTDRNSYRSPNQFGGSGFSKPSAQQQRPPPQEKVHRVFTQHQHAEPPPPRSQSQQPSSHGPPNPGPSSHDAPDGKTGPEVSTGPSPPPKKMSRPKTPLEIIQEVQAEVDKLKAEIDKYNGSSRSDKEYIYLDEMLTRELLKLDNVDSGGVEEIRNLRRTTIKNIQGSIAALEAKVPNTPKSTSEEAQNTTSAEAPTGGTEIQGQQEVATTAAVPMETDAKSEVEAKEGGEGKEPAANQSEAAEPKPGDPGQGDTK